VNKPLEFYDATTTPAEALVDALIWALDKEPSPCRCVPGLSDQLCRAHQALGRARSAQIESPHGRQYPRPLKGSE
jgi:hypothetical protein